MLRNAIIGTVNYTVTHAVAGALQILDKLLKDIVIYKPRDVFHGDKFWGKFFCQSGEM